MQTVILSCMCVRISKMGIVQESVSAKKLATVLSDTGLLVLSGKVTDCGKACSIVVWTWQWLQERVQRIKPARRLNVHYFILEDFTEYYYEKNLDQFDKILSKISITVKKHKMPLLSILFQVWSRSSRKIRSTKRRSVGPVENFKVQSFFQRRL